MDTTLSTRERREQRKANGLEPPMRQSPRESFTGVRAQLLEQLLKVREEHDVALTDEEIAAAFEVNPRTIYRHCRKNPELQHLVDVSGQAAVQRVERSLFHRAVGYEVDDEEVHVIKHRDTKGRMRHKVVRVPVKRRVLPDVNAAQFFLKNRAKAQWRDQWFIQDERPRSVIDGLANLAVIERIEQLRQAVMEKQQQQGLTIEAGSAPEDDAAK